MKTTKQIADELGVSKQQVYRYIKRNRINETLQRNGVMYYDETVEKAIYKHFNINTTSSEVHHETPEPHQSTSGEVVNIDMFNLLKDELNIKNKQIEALQKSLGDVTVALMESQATAKQAQALHAGTIQTQLIDNDNESTVVEKSVNKSGGFKSFWINLFKNDSKV